MTLAASKTATEADVRLELWSSLASLMQSYAAVASLHGVEHGVLVLGDTSLHLEAVRHTLRLSYHATLGRGVWSLYRGTDRHQDALQPRQLQQGNFDIHLDGSVTLDGETVEMDFAAIRLVACLTCAAGQESASSQEKTEVTV